MESLLGIFTAFGLSASAGLNAYIPLLVIALTARFTDLITLRSPWDSLTSWWIIGLLIFLSLIEFLVDKFPVINHINDVIIQSFIRPTAGAIAFAASTNVVTDIKPILALALGLLVSGGVHAAVSVDGQPPDQYPGAAGDRPESGRRGPSGEGPLPLSVAPGPRTQAAAMGR